MSETSAKVLYKLYPEVAGGWGSKTVLGQPVSIVAGGVRHPLVKRLDYEFSGWLGDELLTTHPCYIVTEKLMCDIEGNRLTGYKRREIIMSRSAEFQELFPRRRMPCFWEIVISGRVRIVKGRRYCDWSSHDMCLGPDAELVVTAKALSVFQLHQLSKCEMIALRPA